MEYKKCLLPLPATIVRALQVIEQSAIGVALVVDDCSHLIGTLSDGDIRRGLLRGLTLNDSVEPLVCRNCYYVRQGTSRNHVLDIMQARHIQQVPIVDGKKVIVGIHLLHGLLETHRLDTPAVIMAGGKGTRLGNLTAHTPKPMLKVAGRPILERIILHLMSHGIHNFFLSVNYLSDVIEDYFGDGKSLGCSIRYLREEQPLGSGGALSLLPDDVVAPLLLLNGDLVIEANIRNIIEFHREHDFFATMGYAGYVHEIPFGCLEEKQGRLVRLEEKPTLTRIINAGIYVLSRKSLQAVPRNEFFPITKLFDDALLQGETCGAYPVDGDWIDIGQKSQLNQARGVL